MTAIFNLSIPHLAILGIALVLLINAHYSKSVLSHLLAALILIFHSYSILLPFSQQSILHLSLDLILVALLSLPASRITTRTGKISYLLIALFTLGLGHHFITNAVTAENTITLDPDSELLVEFSSGEELKAWIDTHGTDYDIEYPVFMPADISFPMDEIISINVPENKDVQKLREELLKFPQISYVEYNELMSLQLPEPPSSVQTQKDNNSEDPLSHNQWIYDRFELSKLHDMLSTGPDVSGEQAHIVILDTGIDAAHEDLTGNYKSVNRKYDSDPKGHGTHCAGIAAAVSRNNIGIASLITPGLNIKISSIRVLNNFGTGSQKTLVKGIIEAADLGADVISISIGGMSNDERQRIYTEAVNYATSKGAIVVVSAGNSSTDARKMTPANVEGVITVTSINEQLQRSYFANDVQYLKMGLAAPGEKIFSTFPGNKYEFQNGTSMAAPFVSGLIGLMRLYDPKITAREAYDLLRENAKKENGEIIVDPVTTMETIVSTVN